MRGRWGQGWLFGATGLHKGRATRCSWRERRAAGRSEGDPAGDLLNGGRFDLTGGGGVTKGGMPAGEKEGGTVTVAGLRLQEDRLSRADDGAGTKFRVEKNPVHEVQAVELW